MNHQILINLKVIFASIFVIIVFGVILNWGIGKLILKLESLSERIDQRHFMFFPKFKFTTIILEFTFMVISGVLFYLVIFKAKYWTIVFYIIYIFINSAILKTQLPQQVSFFNIVNDKFEKYYKKVYLLNRIGYFLNKSSGLITLIVMIQITLQFFVMLNWPVHVYYLIFVILPLYSNIWIYFDKLKFNKDKTIVNTRRLILYFLLVIYGFYNGYQQFISLFINNQSLNEYSVFISISSLIFISLDRFFKALADDYEQFCKEKE